jgi:zinc and cadmium transporter
VYCCAIVAFSVCGGAVTSVLRMTHTRLQLLVSFVGGLMLGVGILHQWPHAAALLMETDPANALNWSAGWLMTGLLAMFYLLRTFHFHHHEPFESESREWHSRNSADAIRGLEHDHDHSHDHGHHHHDHDHNHDHDSHAPPGIHGVSWAGVTFGLCLHTILDGVALASNVQADAVHHHADGWLPAGFGTFLGILLHKPLDSLSITSLMLAGGWSARSRLIVNVGYAMMCPLGAMLFFIGLNAVAGREAFVASAALAFSAGVFISIALSDLLPEVQFHSHDRMKLSLALLAGALVAWGIGFAEPKHAHGKHGQPAPAEVRGR